MAVGYKSSQDSETIGLSPHSIVVVVVAGQQP